MCREHTSLARHTSLLTTKSIAARHKAKHLMDRKLPSSTQLPKELPIALASEVSIKGTEKRTLTSDVVLVTVQHVSSMDELVASATHPQLCLGVAQNNLPPTEKAPSSVAGPGGTSPRLSMNQHTGSVQHRPTDQLCHLLGITCQGSEVQLVLCPEDHVLGSDLQNGWGLQGGGNGKKSKLWGQRRPIFRPFVLPMKESQPALKV